MGQVLPKHEKVRFRRDEITDLATLPSGAGIRHKLRRSWPIRIASMFARFAAGLASFVLLAILATYAIGASGVGAERLRSAAQSTLQGVAGAELDASLGAVRLTFDGSRFLAVEVEDVRLARADDAEAIVDAGLVRFGIRFLPLLKGELRLSSAAIFGARIDVGAAPSRGSSDWTAPLRNQEGLFDPDLAPAALFSLVHRALDVIARESAQSIELQDVALALPPEAPLRELRIVRAMLSETGPGSLSLEGEIEANGRPLTATATAARDQASRRISQLEIKLQAADAGSETPAGLVLADGGGRSDEPRPASSLGRLGEMELKLTGAEALGREPSRLTGSLTLRDSALDLGARGVLGGDLQLQSTLVAGANKLSIDRLQARIGRSTFDFYGSLGPRPPTGEAGEHAAYRFDMISKDSRIVAADSPEPALEAYVRLTGTFVETERTLTADEVIVQGSRGEALGSVSIRFAGDRSPGVAAAFSVRDMPVSEVKQLWPWFSARSAREWVMQNLFGGRVAEGRISYQVEPGRMGNGVPLSGREAFGSFSIEGTRFDTAGLIPPIRDAVGRVEFAGNDVDIALSSGSVYMPSGRTVAASKGTLTVKKANVSPVIGALDIEVAGEAAAITELASYEPIDAMSHIGMAPDDFSGEVSGRVTADIPLQKGIDSEKLGWRVALDYSNVAIAKPIDGQIVSEAEGTITVEPAKAVIVARGKLSGVAAEIKATEPLREGAERQRLVTLTLDDKARKILVPGLAHLVSGPVKVTLDAAGKGRHEVSADLTQARLALPWVGWTKGPGIAADVHFMLENAKGKSKLSRFSLSGKSFGVSGEVVLSNGSLASANLSSVKLNRGDDVAVTVKSSGGGYTVDVRGRSLDARSLVRQFTGDTGTATKATAGGAISVTAAVDTMTGFHEERLSGLKLTYKGRGERVLGLDLAAKTSSGAKVELRNVSDGGSRSIRMQSADAGALLRFLDIYPRMQGGRIELALDGGAKGPMKGQVDARDFWLVNEPRLSSMVSTTPPGDSRSLNQAVRKDIDVTRVKFERGFTQLDKGDGYLKLASGVLRGPLIGLSFQGTLYDRNGNMDMTGTFMPAYGLNRIFGELPLIGIILGNGRDRGLIGVTFKLDGDADSPDLQINPLSVIAPGIFRSIFEFR